MDLRQISYFVALFEEGSVTRAAQRMHVVQPALSMQMAKPGAELGQKLFGRTPKSMEPTAAAPTLYRMVQPILRDLARARERAGAFRRHLSRRSAHWMLHYTGMIDAAKLDRRFCQSIPQTRSDEIEEGAQLER